MKMKRYIHYIYLGAIAILMACSEDLCLTDITKSSSEAINLSAGYQTLTRVTEQGFDDGDEMGVYIVDFVNGQSASLNGDKMHADNVRYSYSLAENAWTGATTLYWLDKTTPVDIYGYYPFDDTMSSPTAYAFSVNSRQDALPTPGRKGGYEASDLLWAKAGNVAPTNETIQLLYHHLMAGVTIRLQKGDDFADDEWQKAEKMAWIYNTVPSATVNLEEGTVSPVGKDVVRITPLDYNGDYRAVVVPQTIDGGKALIGLNVDGYNYSFTKDVSFTYTSGKMHTFTICVNKRTDTGDYVFSVQDEAVTAWLDDAEFHDGIVTEYVSVNVEQPGTLGETMKNMGLDIARIECLKLTGTVDWDDFGFIRENQKTLIKLNLYDVIIDDKDDELDDAVGNLGGHRWGWADKSCNMLRYVFLPKRLKKIADYAFAGCPLVGSFILPEGLEYIGRESMTAAGANGGCPDFPVGELYLPSTLKYIGDAAFLACAFRGELHLPLGLEYIGDRAFDHSIFSGNLNLPNTLKHYGYSAISGRFTGDLIFPQGIKDVSNFAFIGCTFTGTVYFPEGVETIGSAAFRDEAVMVHCGMETSFYGELVLPSTITEIHDAAFQNCGITKIVWPENLKLLGAGAFADCYRLTGTLSIPKGISAIEDNLFSNARLLTGIELHEDICYLGNGAFAGCRNLSTIICHADEPPVIGDNTFEGVPLSNVTVEVPEKSLTKYQNDDCWKLFKRITAYKNFVTRPQKLCALNSTHEQIITINAEGNWTVTHQPDWCRLSQTKGSKKSQVRVSIDEMERGSGDREDYIEFTLDGTSYTTRCEVKQYDYEHAEDEVVTLQKHTRGNGIKIAFLGDGWNGEDIASGSYLEQCRQDMEHFFGLPPYDRLRDYFDIYAPIALSQESGVNTLYTILDTRFGTIYSAGTAGVYEPKLIPDEDAIFSYLKTDVEVFADDNELRKGLVVLIPNTTDYNGITYFFDDRAISICPPLANPYPNDMRGVIQHEACGHGFGKLGDELITMTAFASNAAKADIGKAQAKGWYQNIATTGKMSDVPWTHLIFDPRYSDYVDIFEGGYGYTRGIYRSEANSCMNYGIPYFNAISRQDITKRVKEAAGEWFNIEEFYANDTKRWGASSNSSGGSTRAGGNGSGYSLVPISNPAPVFVQGSELRNQLKELREKQSKNNK